LVSVTGDSGTAQAAGASMDEDDMEEALEAAGVSFSLCSSPPSSHRSDVIFASWFCLQKKEGAGFTSGDQSVTRFNL